MPIWSASFLCCREAATGGRPTRPAVFLMPPFSPLASVVSSTFQMVPDHFPVPPEVPLQLQPLIHPAPGSYPDPAQQPQVCPQLASPVVEKSGLLHHLSAPSSNTLPTTGSSKNTGFLDVLGVCQHGATPGPLHLLWFCLLQGPSWPCCVCDLATWTPLTLSASLSFFPCCFLCSTTTF